MKVCVAERMKVCVAERMKRLCSRKDETFVQQKG